MGAKIGVTIGQDTFVEHPALSPCGPVLSGWTTISREQGLRHGWARADKSPPSNDPACVRAYLDGYALGEQGYYKSQFRRKYGR